MMFKITVDLRRARSGDDYAVHSYKSWVNDVQEHMLWLNKNGWEVLNIHSEPFNPELDQSLRVSNDFMTFINCESEHVTDSDTNESSGSDRPS